MGSFTTILPELGVLDSGYKNLYGNNLEVHYKDGLGIITTPFVSNGIRVLGSDYKNANIYDCCLAVAANIDYIDSCFAVAERHKLLTYRISICGYGRAGKDTVASLLANQFGYKYGGSTSFGINPLICSALFGVNDQETQKKCYETRHANRLFWYDFCNLLRRIDPLMLIKLNLVNSDFIIGTRSREEFVNSLDYFKPHNVLWITRKGTPDDPTLDYSREFVAEECNKRGIRHTTIGNNDDVATLNQQLANCVREGIILKGPYDSPDVREIVRRTNTI